MIDYELLRAVQPAEDYELWRWRALAGMAAERAELLFLLLGIDEETLTGRPVFEEVTAKDLLAHLAAWDERHRERLALALAGRVEEAADFDLDRWNAREQARREDWPLNKVVQSLEKARDAFVETVLRADVEALHHTPEMPWSDSMPPRTWILARARHDANHLADLRRWRRRLEDERDEKPHIGPRSLLLAAMRSSRADIGMLAELVEPAARESRPLHGDWTLRDSVGHLADWDQFLLEILGAGRLLDMGYGGDVQQWNEAHAAARRGQPWTATWSDYEQVKDSLFALVQQSPETFLAERLSNPWGMDRSVYQVVVNWLEHEREHARGLHDALSETEPS